MQMSTVASCDYPVDITSDTLCSSNAQCQRNRADDHPCPINAIHADFRYDVWARRMPIPLVSTAGQTVLGDPVAFINNGIGMYSKTRAG